MLELRGIKKEYKTGDFIQTALDGVDLDFRDNEFVAILGPSGSGKTTMLNIIGGLDRYDSGDLIINGVSTKNYKDRDWDTYRNHAIGFVFQSYNLISHQTVLANVELALTISGVSKSERKKRALKVLKQVGLRDHAKKKPNQLSGGQMQRVAIARALVNDPDILLADEPTGALDSTTSVQVMDLLKEVAKDRLVVMVTHNPQLAEKYATRIVNIEDGKIVSDSDAPTEEEKRASLVNAELQDERTSEKKISKNNDLGAKTVHKGRKKKASMNFITALGLSFSNLLTKKARTILVAFAGSIGIIGIALILSLSNGINEYIDRLEEDTLSEYPIQIMKTNMDFTAMLKETQDTMGKRKKGDKEVREIRTVTNTFSNIKTNDLKTFKGHIEANEKTFDQYAKAVEYSYNVVPLIYKESDKNKIRQVNPEKAYESMGVTDSYSSMAANMGMTFDNFFKLPDEEGLYKTQYSIKAGHWPENEDELVLVLSENNNVSDRVLYSLGIRDAKELDKAIKAYSSGKKIKISKKKHSFNFKDFIGMEFKLVDSYKCYKYDKKYKVWASKKDNNKYMKKLVAKSRPIKIVGVVSAKEDASAKMLMPGIYYTSDLVNGVIDRASGSKVVKDQLAHPNTNVFTGKKFDDTGKKGGVDFTKLFSFDADAMKKIFSFDMNSLDFNSLGFDANSVSDIFKNAGKKTSEKELQKLFADLMSGYQAYAKKHNTDTFDELSSGFEKYMSSPEASKIIQNEMASIIKKSGASMDGQAITKILTKVMSGFQSYINKKGYKDVSKMGTYLNEYLGSQEAQALLAEAMQEYMPKIDPSSMDFNKLVTKLMNGYNKYAKKHKLATMNSVMRGFRKYLSSDDASGKINKIVNSMVDTKAIQNSMASAMSGFSNGLRNMFNFDPTSLASAFKMKAGKKELEDLMSSLMSKEISTYEQNMKNLGYADKSEPFEIELYPKSFESKDKLGGLIKDYNKKMKASGQKNKTIAYTDIVGTLMSSVTEIVNALSYILIAFVGISLVVSSIMIGVITYISVLERKKEIGVLRAIGASKRNVSNVFNAETFIVGALAGVIGIIITHILLIPMNMIIKYLGDGIEMTAYLPFSSALILIAISIVLTLLGGLIPAKKAAHQDPVIALRSE